MAERDHPAGDDGPVPADRGHNAALPSDFTRSLSELAALSTADLKLTEMLTQVATLAVLAIPGADGAGLTLLEVDRSDLIVKSEPFVRTIDDIQYGIGEGPCISAAAAGLTMRSGLLRDDPRWRMFGPRASQQGVNSALSLPLLTPSGVIGAINVYAHDWDSFNAQAQQIGESYALSAAMAVLHAQILDQARRFAYELQQGLRGRVLIEKAVGILRQRHRISADQAREQLQSIVRRQQISLTAAAGSIVAGGAPGQQRPSD